VKSRALGLCDQYRLGANYILPAVEHHDDCTGRGLCVRNRQLTVIDGMLLFSKTRNFFARKGDFEKLKNLDIPGFHPKGRERLFADLKTSGLFWDEEQHLQKGAEAIKQILAENGPIHPRPELRCIDVDVERVP